MTSSEGSTSFLSFATDSSISFGTSFFGAVARQKKKASGRVVSSSIWMTSSQNSREGPSVPWRQSGKSDLLTDLPSSPKVTTYCGSREREASRLFSCPSDLYHPWSRSLVEIFHMLSKIEGGDFINPGGGDADKSPSQF